MDNLIKKLFEKINKSPKIKKVLLALGILIFLAGCIWSIIVMQIAQYYDANSKTVDNFLTYASHEDYKQAYALFADKYKREEDFETFKKNILPGKSIYLDYKANSFRITRTTFFIFPLNPLTLRYIGEISYNN